MDILPPTSSKKAKSSFWTRLLGLSKKTTSNDQCSRNKSFSRFNKLHVSLRNSSHSHNDTQSSNGTESFTTFEDIHKEAGILFLNQKNISDELKESNKHVQFAPTPMNKYYSVSRDKHQENKENITYDNKRLQPILRFSKKSEVLPKLSQKTKQLSDDLKLKVQYIDEPETKRTLFPRTSTKMALLEKQNVSLPQLNISSISSYQVLSKKPTQRKHEISNFQSFSVSELGQVEFEETAPKQTSKRYSLFQNTAKNEWKQQSLVKNSSHRQSCYGVSNPSSMAQNRAQNQNCVTNKYITEQHNIDFAQKYRKYSDRQGIFASHDTKQFHSNQELNTLQTSTSLTKNILNYGSLKGNKKSYFPTNDNYRNKKIKDSSNIAINSEVPSKSLNEVGLPLVPPTFEKKREIKNNKSGNYSQYILLSETISSSKNAGNNFLNVPRKETIVFDETKNKSNQQSMAFFKKPCSKIYQMDREKLSNCLGDKIRKELTTDKSVSSILTIHEHTNPILSSNRKKSIKSMYTQKKKQDKSCKYKKEDGFSSMADDECSFNCSCSSCTTRATQNKKSLLHQNRSTYFFTCDDHILADTSKDKVEPQTLIQQESSVLSKEINENGKNTTYRKNWYECSDSPCQTPVNSKSTVFSKSGIEENRNNKTPSCIAENIYENIAQIINSATKKKINSDDVKQILSTPKSQKGKMITSLTSYHLALSPGKTIKESSGIVTNSSLNSLINEQVKKRDDSFNESNILLLQEIFQKLSLECQELLKSSTLNTSSNLNASDSSIHKLLIKIGDNEFSKEELAEIIGSIAGNLFTETKSKKNMITPLSSSISLPDLKNAQSIKITYFRTSPKHICGPSKSKSLSVIDSTVKSKFVHDINKFNKISLKPLQNNLINKAVTSDSKNTLECTQVTFSTEAVIELTHPEKKQIIGKNSLNLGVGLQTAEKLLKIPFYAKSPAKIAKYKSKDVLSGKAKLKLQIYHNSGLVTVHIIRAAKLARVNGNDLNPYVKVSMVPDDSRKAHWRTNVRKSQKDPIFNQKFSFEVFSHDSSKRLVLSVWHRDYTKQRSEFIGCMSFSVRHVMDDTQCIDGWYRLLREGFGTQKHFAAQTRKV